MDEAGCSKTGLKHFVLELMFLFIIYKYTINSLKDLYTKYYYDDVISYKSNSSKRTKFYKNFYYAAKFLCLDMVLQSKISNFKLQKIL